MNRAKGRWPIRRWHAAAMIAALVQVPGGDGYFPVLRAFIAFCGSDVGEGSRLFWLGVLGVYWLVVSVVAYAILSLGHRVLRYGTPRDQR